VADLSVPDRALPEKARATPALWFVDPDAISREHEVVTPEHPVPAGFDGAVPSWNVRTPGGSWMEIAMRARVDGRWTRWYAIARWSASDDAQRHSCSGQDDEDGSVATDCLSLGAAADAVQLRAGGHAGPTGRWPQLAMLAVSAWRRGTFDDAHDPRPAKAITLDVPMLSQRAETGATADEGDAWCSPTSLAMVMQYWAGREDEPRWRVTAEQAARGCYDSVYRGCGNWPFNVAFASEHGLCGWVERLGSVTDLEDAVLGGVPMIASIRVAPGELRGAPYEKTDGHLLVVRGFTSHGDLICNDPYGLPGSIERIYDRREFVRAWHGGSDGIVYRILPPRMTPPRGAMLAGRIGP
jgi:hypothetical protein